MNDRPREATDRTKKPKPGIELNTVQLVSSMAAAVTGAVLTSYLGDGGTILGTAVGSGASTAGFAVYKHYLVRTKEKVAPVLVERARQWTPTGIVTSDQRPTRADADPDATRVDRAVDQNGFPRNSNGNGNGHRNGQYENGNGQRSGPATTRADWEQARRTAPGWAEPTRADPGWRPDATGQDVNQTRQDQYPTRQDAAPTRTARYDQDGRYGTVQLGTGPNGAPSGSGYPGSGGPGKHGRSGGFAGWLSDRPRWVLTVGSAVAVFLVVMIAITVIELGTGKPIDASVWGRSQTGTTLGGSHASTSTTPTPAPSATPSAGTSGSSGATSGVQQGGVNPTGSATPAPSSVPTVGSTGGASGAASGGASPGGAGAANNATVAPGQ